MRPSAFASLYEYLLIAIVSCPWEQRIYSRLFFDRDPGDPALVEQRFGKYKMLAVHYLWQDLFWRRVHQPVDWLEALIRL